MARGVTSNPALEAWKARALQPCRLPSGAWVKVKVPDAEALMRAGAMPTELLGVLTAFVGSGVDTETLDAAELQSWIAFMRDLAARSVKAITPETSDTMTPPGGWEDVELTPEDFDELPVVDQQALRVIALRRSTPNTVTVQTLLDDEMIEDQRAAWAKAREAGGTVDAWTDFRDNGPGPVAGDDREDVRPEPVAVVPGT